MIRIAARAFLMTFLVACSTIAIADRHYWLAPIISFLIQWNWWGAAHHAGKAHQPGARWLHALGGSAGVLAGLYVFG